MKLIQPFEALIQNGVSLTLKFAAAGDGQIQLDILPAGKDTKTGVALPPKALFGTAAELDAFLEGFVEKYANSVQRIADVVANADQELQQAEAAAATQARQAVDTKRANKSTTKPGAGTKSSASTPKKRDLGAGMIGEEGGEGEDDTDDDQVGGNDQRGGDEAETTLNTAGGAGSGGSGEAGTPDSSASSQPTGALSPALF